MPLRWCAHAKHFLLSLSARRCERCAVFFRAARRLRPRSHTSNCALYTRRRFFRRTPAEHGRTCARDGDGDHNIPIAKTCGALGPLKGDGGWIRDFVVRLRNAQAGGQANQAHGGYYTQWPPKRLSSSLLHHVAQRRLAIVRSQSRPGGILWSGEQQGAAGADRADTICFQDSFSLECVYLETPQH